MSQDLVSAVSRAAADPTAVLDRLQTANATANLQALTDPASVATNPGGAAIRAAGPTALEPSSAMNLHSLANQFSTGLEHGFYAGDIDRLMHKLDLSHQPGSGVTFGDVTVELLNVQAKVGIADAFSKVSAKLAEGLQTMVVRQG